MKTIARWLSVMMVALTLSVTSLAQYSGFVQPNDGSEQDITPYSWISDMQATLDGETNYGGCPVVNVTHQVINSFDGLYNPSTGALATNQWENLPALASTAISLSQSNDGQLWAVDNADRIWRYDLSGKWVQISGALVQISAGSQTNIWGVNSAGSIFHYVNGGWPSVAGSLKQVSAAADGSVWGVNSGNLIYKWNGSGWTQMPGSATWVDNQGANGVTIIGGVNTTYNSNVYNWNGSGWTVFKHSGVMQKLHFPFATDANHRAWYWNYSSSVWSQYTNLTYADDVTSANATQATAVIFGIGGSTPLRRYLSTVAPGGTVISGLNTVVNITNYNFLNDFPLSDQFLGDTTETVTANCLGGTGVILAKFSWPRLPLLIAHSHGKWGGNTYNCATYLGFEECSYDVTPYCINTSSPTLWPPNGLVNHILSPSSPAYDLYGPCEYIGTKWSCPQVGAALKDNTNPPVKTSCDVLN